MLDVKKNRLDYGAMLIPPEGYRLTKAVAATYSLDLNTLLSIPVALFFSQTLEGNFDAERVQLLEAIQRCPDVLRVYHQAGKIHVPQKQNRLYGLLEPCVVGVLPADAFSSFHPKVWVLRYEHDDKPTSYRLIVLSRNLTYDRSWDVAVHLDGEVTEERQAKVEPIVSFVKYLTAHEGFDGERKFLSDLRRVRFETPRGFSKKFTFHPVGIDGYPNPIIEQTSKKTICISPFVHDAAINTLWENAEEELLLFGCREEMRNLKPETLDGVRAFCISDLIVDGESQENSEDGEGEQHQQNLHAKLYVMKTASWVNQWFLGSANATKAAFDRNVEVLLELRGTSEAAQLERLKDQLLGEDENRGIFQPYEPPEDLSVDPAVKKLEEQLRKLEFQLLSFTEKMQASVKQSENESNYDLHLVVPKVVGDWGDMSITVAPFNAEGVRPQQLSDEGATTLFFANINESNLSRFVQFEIWQGGERCRAFLMKIVIQDLPESRVSRILRSIIDSRDRFFEYLRFLLADDGNKGEIGTKDIVSSGEGEANSREIWDMDMPIFEQLLLAASRSPSQLLAIDDVIQKLREEEEEEEVDKRVIPHEFLEFWDAFKEIVPQSNRRKRS